MRRINLLDSGFLIMESRETPMHVAGVNLFTLPERANPQRFMTRLGEVYSSAEEFRKPFGEFVTTGKLGSLGPLYWETDSDLDMEYHVRHSALPKPGRYRELFALVSRLHGTLLDRSRPLWEVHLIEGLQNRQFVIYTKMHHAAVDGVAALQLTESMCSTNRKTRIDYSPMSLEAFENFRQVKRSRPVMPKDRELKAVADIFREQLNTPRHLLGVVKSYAQTWLGAGGGVAVPWRHIPKTSINTQVSGSRRFVAQSWDLGRVKAICKAVDGTVNDVVLAMCAGALRRYLMAQNELPEHSLRAMVPVSVRLEGDIDSTNSVSAIVVDLATRHADPEKRLAVIMQSAQAGKDMIKGLSAREASLLAQISQLPMLVTTMLGIADHFPPFSTTISNVPGPRKQQYWNGARLEGIYPASAIFHGFALNITLVGYHGKLDFGIMACRRSVPQVQRLIDYLEEALVELEEMIA